MFHHEICICFRFRHFFLLPAVAGGITDVLVLCEVLPFRLCWSLARPIFHLARQSPDLFPPGAFLARVFCCLSPRIRSCVGISPTELCRISFWTVHCASSQSPVLMIDCSRECRTCTCKRCRVLQTVNLTPQLKRTRRSSTTAELVRVVLVTQDLVTKDEFTELEAIVASVSTNTLMQR